MFDGPVDKPPWRDEGGPSYSNGPRASSCSTTTDAECTTLKIWDYQERQYQKTSTDINEHYHSRCGIHCRKFWPDAQGILLFWVSSWLRVGAGGGPVPKNSGSKQVNGLRRRRRRDSHQPHLEEIWYSIIIYNRVICFGPSMINICCSWLLICVSLNCKYSKVSHQ